MANVESPMVENSAVETIPANQNIDLVDASNALLTQMQLLAFNNKLFLKLA